MQINKVMDTLMYNNDNKSFSVDLSEPKLLAGMVILFHGVDRKNPRNGATAYDYTSYCYKVQNMTDKTILYNIQKDLLNELLNRLIIGCAKFLKIKERNLDYEYEIVDFITQPCKSEADFEKFDKKFAVAIGVAKNKLGK